MDRQVLPMLAFIPAELDISSDAEEEEGGLEWVALAALGPEPLGWTR
jgi:hypothetical protein